jgi:formate dehydrogenase iron-sulfur subunit
MSAPLANNPFTPIPSFDGLLDDLLKQQSTFSAVDTFSAWHETQGHTSALAPHYVALMPTSPLKAGEQYAFEVDLDACSGCKACVVACHNLNSLDSDETWRKVGWLTTQDKDVNAFSSNALPIVQHVTTACHHCVDPGCLNGCPVKAYEKDPLTGIVKHLDDQCFGCKYCTMMCPYEVPQYSPKLGIVRKCDMCHQRLAHDEAPACVQACPNKAIRIRSIETAAVRQSGTLAEATLLPTAPPSAITLPTTQFVSKRMKARNVVSIESVRDELHEGHLPLVGMLVLTQASVGLWFAIAWRLTLGKDNTSELRWYGLLATILGVVGVHLALLHLGRPHLAYRAFLGWRTSWLSREAIGFGLYLGATGAATLGSFYFTSRQGATETTVLLLLTIGTAVMGVVAVVCSAMIYVATRRSLWNSWRTIGGFLGTSLALGLVLSNLTSESSILGLNALLACTISLAVFAAQLSDTFLSRTKSAQSNRGSFRSRSAPHEFSARSGRLILSHLMKEWATMWSFWLTALIASMFCFIPAGTSTLFGVIATLCLLVAHGVHRWIYFSAVVSYRMPGASS